jgi:acyl-CoA dehydrogenase
LVALGYMWGRMAVAARKKRDGDASGRMNAKLVIGRHFMDYILPETTTRLARITAGAAGMMDLPAEMF